MNKAMLIGYVGQEPAVKYLDRGICVASLRLATSERGYTMKDGTQVPERTEWHNILFWRGLAETVEKYVHKGDRLYVEGRIRKRAYDDKMGVHHEIVEIEADNMEMLSAPSVQRMGATPATQKPDVQNSVPMSDKDDKPPF